MAGLGSIEFRLVAWTLLCLVTGALFVAPMERGRGGVVVRFFVAAGVGGRVVCDEWTDASF